MRGVTRRAWMATALASLAGCSALDVLNAVSTSDASVPALGLPYGAHPRQRLDVYRPVRPMEGPPRAVVFFYGGSWREGDRKDYAFVGEALAEMQVDAPRAAFQAVVDDWLERRSEGQG